MAVTILTMEARASAMVVESSEKERERATSDELWFFPFWCLVCKMLKF